MKDTIEKELLELIKTREFIKTEEIAEITGVSSSTVRRNLNQLQNKGLITRTRGGAKINDEKNYFPNFSFRSHTNSLEKKKSPFRRLNLSKTGT